jgi:hypothetical protein
VALAVSDIELAATMLNRTSQELQIVRARLAKAAKLVKGAKGHAK